ncbi:putative Rho2-GTP binding protein Rho2 [Jaminaea rosea]|uniref:Putative Rho2-GTP binding protein Rho2 n=1 Tax=Jaminaea rosea TaxID=1569628 RepID=A0A316UR04_9BASI|nr:putative Rho2-GTP binding protein Rho2 [Jaminaea rosea]PWN26303.1 putative Rho2-GTP binding protein Rho2 [Jaminaea rosea]
MAPDPIRRKLVIVGDGACGKTSLLCVFAIGEFPQQYEPTIFENYVAEIRLDGKPVQLALWDTAGQEEYERLRPLSYAQAHVILIAFSIDTPDSLENVTVKWIEEVRQICGPHVPVILIGCKRDLRDDAMARGRQLDGYFVSQAQGSEVAQQIGARSYYECSALKNEGVDNIFEAATRAAMLSRPAHSGGNRGSGGEKGSGSKSGRKNSNEAGGCQCVVL